MMIQHVRGAYIAKVGILREEIAGKVWLLCAGKADEIPTYAPIAKSLDL
jgi:hypothetical protein